MSKSKEVEKVSSQELAACPDLSLWQAKKDKTKTLIQVESEGNRATLSLVGIDDKLSPEQQTQIAHQEIFKATGAIDPTFGLKLMGQHVNCTRSPNDIEASVDEINSYLVTMNALEPADEIEGMLCTQILSLHDQAMNNLRLMNGSTSVERSEKYGNMATKLMRLHSEKIEALARYRRKGTQQMIVQHVNVERGGKAVVGAMNQGGAPIKNNGGTS